jgi:hypothetical protein
VVTDINLRHKFLYNVTQLLPQRFLTGLLFNYYDFWFIVVNCMC